MRRERTSSCRPQVRGSRRKRRQVGHREVCARVEPAAIVRVLPMQLQLQVGDRLTNESGTWQVIARGPTRQPGARTHRCVQVDTSGGDGDTAVGFLREGDGHTARQRRGGPAMMRLRRASAIITLLLLTSVATASAECGWCRG